eukprot:SAG22_NODE_714_length_7722_cov_3.919585_5_plen_142_part_00
MAAMAQELHTRGAMVKAYFTTREISTRAAELWALKALGTEIFLPGPGPGGSCRPAIPAKGLGYCGSAWLQEHFGENYYPAWTNAISFQILGGSFPPGTLDSSVANNGWSRWNVSFAVIRLNSVLTIPKFALAFVRISMWRR